LGEERKAKRERGERKAKGGKKWKGSEREKQGKKGEGDRGVGDIVCSCDFFLGKTLTLLVGR